MALRLLHIVLVLCSFCSFAGRFILSEYWPQRSRAKWLKIAPPILDTALLGSGIALAVQGGWFSPLAPWLLVKLLALCAYIALGVAAMRLQGRHRWRAFAAAVVCYGYILAAAITKNALLFG